MRRLVHLIFVLMLSCVAFSQENSTLSVKVLNDQQRPLVNASVELLKLDSNLIKVLVSDSLGEVHFSQLTLPGYFLRVSAKNLAPAFQYVRPGKEMVLITLLTFDKTMDHIFVRGRRPFLEMRTDRTVVNVEAGITNAGISVMETLEKLPGVTLDRNGKISLRGRSGTLVYIDGKQTFLSEADLSTLLSGMAASQVAQIELIHSPSASFNAAGNAGVINIRLKKNTQRGFNGSLNLSFAQGYYPKSNNSLLLNYQNGRWNLFANLAYNKARSFTRAYALRTYLKTDGSAAALLEQPNFRTGVSETKSLRSGVDYALNKKASLGLLVNTSIIDRNSVGSGDAVWMKVNREQDSLVRTINRNRTDYNQLDLNLNYRQDLSGGDQFSADVEHVRYRIRGFQQVDNSGLLPRIYSEALRADIPMNINVSSAKADYSHRGKEARLNVGLMSTFNRTDNTSNYEQWNGRMWLPDPDKSNHFDYKEHIHAVYGDWQRTINHWNIQAGLRFERTHYSGRQFANDSSFARIYNSFFPTATVSYERDSAHTFTFNANRRIDRPEFQKLNPFLLIINKYTYQTGNPYLRPQFTWNFELSHSYRNMLLTTVSYATTSDFFSQIFPLQNNGIILYTVGNLRRLQNFGATVGYQHNPTPWWSLSLQAGVNHKILEGTIVQPLRATNTQFNVNWNNQFRLGNDWAGELNSFYVSASREDLQEVLDPYGQVSLGLSKSFSQNRGTIRLNIRDIFYTNWTRGFATFFGATEYFDQTRDTRVATLAFTWRFGKAMKTARRSEGAAAEQLQRVSSGQQLP